MLLIGGTDELSLQEWMSYNLQIYLHTCSAFWVCISSYEWLEFDDDFFSLFCSCNQFVSLFLKVIQIEFIDLARWSSVVSILGSVFNLHFDE